MPYCKVNIITRFNTTKLFTTIFDIDIYELYFASRVINTTSPDGNFHAISHANNIILQIEQ